MCDGACELGPSPGSVLQHAAEAGSCRGLWGLGQSLSMGEGVCPVTRRSGPSMMLPGVVWPNTPSLCTGRNSGDQDRVGV